MNARQLFWLLALGAALAGCGGDDGECSSNADCASLGAYTCRKATGQCVALTDDRCTTVHGDYQNDEALLVGSILPTTGASSASGLPVEHAITLALDELASAGGPARRPIALLGCSDNDDGDAAVAAARHLVDDVGVPAIIGGAYSGVTLKIATEVTIPAGVLLFSPSATSVNITDLADQGLVWRASPSDTAQALAIAAYVPAIEQRVRADLALGQTDKIKVAVVHKGDAYGKDLAGLLEQALVINGLPAGSAENQQSYLRVNYGDPADPGGSPTKFPETVSAVLAFEPHITLVVGTYEGIVDVFIPVEEGWPAASTYRSSFVFSDGGKLPELWQFVAANDPDGSLRKRISGTTPGADNKLFHTFRAGFLAKFMDGASPDVFGAAGGYDITYLLAYGAAALGNAPVTGAALAGSFGKLVPPGSPVDVGPAGAAAAFGALAGGGAVDFNGASGPLDFDLETGEAVSDIQVWCLGKDASSGGAIGAVYSGLTYDAKTMALTGAVGPSCD